MSRVRTTAQAQSLQRCSTSSCSVCGAQSRLTALIAIEQWCPTADGLAYIMTSEHPARHRSVCARHKDFKGVAIYPREYGQLNRVFLV